MKRYTINYTVERDGIPVTLDINGRVSVETGRVVELEASYTFGPQAGQTCKLAPEEIRQLANRMERHYKATLFDLAA